MAVCDVAHGDAGKPDLHRGGRHHGRAGGAAGVIPATALSETNKVRPLACCWRVDRQRRGGKKNAGSYVQK